MHRASKNNKIIIAQTFCFVEWYLNNFSKNVENSKNGKAASAALPQKFAIKMLKITYRIPGWR